MKLPTLDTRPSLAPLMEALLAETDRREPEPLTNRERATEAGLALLLIGACGLMILVAGGVDNFDVGPAIALTVAYALAVRVRFYVGAAHTAQYSTQTTPGWITTFGRMILLFYGQKDGFRERNRRKVTILHKF